MATMLEGGGGRATRKKVAASLTCLVLKINFFVHVTFFLVINLGLRRKGRERNQAAAVTTKTTEQATL